MKILHLTDIHSNLQYLETIEELKLIDIVVLSGDITHFGKINDVKNIIDIISEKIRKPILAVPGNCDYPEVSTKLDELKISVENRVINFNEYQFCGIGGSLPCPGTTPNELSEEKYIQILHNIESRLSTNRKTILISHQPPYRTRNDKVLFGFHVGSKAIRKFIEKNRPLICLTGHIHEGKGIDYIGKCPVVNPGPFRNGRYAIIELIGEHPPVISIF